MSTVAAHSEVNEQPVGIAAVQGAILQPAITRGFAGSMRNIGLAVAASIFVVIPCFWQPAVQSIDLGSHTYNLWLSTQIQTGNASGIVAVTQPTNILFDLLLKYFAGAAGIEYAERICSALSVLAFFWGAVAFVSGFSAGFRPISMLWISMLAYGLIFRLGFFNFYVATGLSLLGMALLWRSGRVRVCGLGLLIFAITAHFLPVAWALAVLAYVWLQKRLACRSWILLPFSIVMIVVIKAIFGESDSAGWYVARTVGGLPALVGADQVWIYGFKYAVIALALTALPIVAILKIAESRGTRSLWLDVRFQLLILHAIAIAMLPQAVRLDEYGIPLTFIVERLSLFAALMSAAVYFSTGGNWPERAVLLSSTLFFFLFSYVDERAINSFAEKLNASVRQVPAGSRVVGTFQDLSSRTPALLHILDRACVGHCFSFANYEPSSGHFRLRTIRSNPYVTHERKFVEGVELGRHRVREADLPLIHLRRCETTQGICTVALHSGDLVSASEVRVLPALWW